MSKILWAKSSSWRWMVKQTRDSKPFFFAFATVCGVVPGAIGYCVMQFTNSTNEQLESQLRRGARPDTLMMGKVNKERLGEYLGELQRKEDTNDRYVAALKGEILTRDPHLKNQQPATTNAKSAQVNKKN